jgi:membrane-associated phospholipid phosphatase
MSKTARITLRVLIVWAIATAIALPLDRATAVWVWHHHPLIRYYWTRQMLRLPGNYFFVLPLAIVVLFIHPRNIRAALPIILTGAPVGLIYTVVKWIVGRKRPKVVLEPFTFHPFMDGIKGLFVSVGGLSFPSGDAMMASAWAVTMSIAFPRWAPAFWTWLVIVCAERVLENAHYLTDVISGAAAGVGCAALALYASDRILREVETRGWDHLHLLETRT